MKRAHARRDSSGVKLIFSIGPASRTPKIMEQLIRAGIDVARLHCSYSNQNERSENILRLRGAAKKWHCDLKILQDLSGTKVRLGEFERGSVRLKEGDFFTLTSRPVKGDGHIASVSIPEIISVIKKGDKVLLADGALELKAVSVSKTDARCQVTIGGKLKTEQAVHVPGRVAPVSVPTLKDLDDVRFGIQRGVDWIALSYVSRADEIKALRRFISQQGAKTPIVAKIERPAAVKNLEAIVRAADLVMVARGDLGIEPGIEHVGLLQKRIVACARKAKKPVIIATELLFSMMDHDKPTRAEAVDITNAVLDGVDGLMLSGETAMGKFPIEAAQTLKRIVETVQKNKGKLKKVIS